MCGICGIYWRSGRTVQPHVLRQMTDTLWHRGPDDSGIWSEGRIGLGHRRLSIRDLSAAGHQPQSDASGRIVVSYNGEIYNDAELRQALSRDHGVTFRSTCDTEVLPVGYMHWGDKLFDRLEGMYAIALWDRAQGKLILARDGIGIKPLFYSANRDCVRFGSEIKALLADPEQACRISPKGLHRFLALGYVGPTSTSFETIEQVPPGTVLTFSDREQTARQFWQPSRRPDIRSLDDAVDGFLEIWPSVVKDHLVSDVGIGVLQSGGIDSTLVSLAACRGAASPPPLFTATFADDSFNEEPLARKVAEHLGASFHRCPVVPESDQGAMLRKVVAAYDGQVADEASIPLYLLSSAVRQRVTVALCGDGGDEFFGGYPTYQASRSAAILAWMLPGRLWEAIGRRLYAGGAGDESRLPVRSRLARLSLGIAAGGAQGAHAYWRRYIPDFLLNDLYGPALKDLRDTDPAAEYRTILRGAAGRLVDRCLLADQTFHLPGGLLLKTDAMTMAHGLEVRVPLLDRRMMEFASRIASPLIMGRAGETKPVLRAAARRLGAPDAVVAKGKRGFNAPLARLLRTELAPIAEQYLEREADRLAPWLQPASVRRLWRDHKNIRANHDYALWPILNFGIHLDSATWSRVPQRTATSRAV